MDDSRSPISALPDDILWYIFWLNTDMMHETEDDPIPLFTLLESSHVCSKWRELILASSSLWGEVVDLDWLRHNKEWRDEVVHRTGESLVCVMGRTNRVLASDLGSGMDIMVSFLEEQWSRIRCLDMTFYDSQEWRQFEDRVWEVLQRSAHHLQMFIFTTPVDVRFPRDMVLFNDQAPQIRVFEASRIRFSPKAPWLHNIRDLCLTGPLSLRELLLALQNMTYLEMLHDDSESIVDEDDHADDFDLPHVRVPSLEMVDFSMAADIIAPYLKLLQHITPCHGCALSFIIFADEHELSEEKDLKEVVQIVPIFSAYCKLDEATEIDLDLGNARHFDLKAILPGRGISRFKVHITNSVPRHTYFVRPLLAALLRPSFRDIKKLCLIIESRAEILPTHQEIINFVHLFQSITVLRTSPGSTKFFMKMPLDVLRLSFPSLLTIEFTSSPKQEDMVSVRAFLRCLMATRHPIQTISLPDADDGRKASMEGFSNMQAVFG